MSVDPLGEATGDTTLEDRRLRTPTARGRGEPLLYVALECARPLAGGARYALSDVRTIVFGRGAERIATREVVDEQRTLVLRVPDKWMSSTHARLRRTGEGWLLEDAPSTNGTFVNGARVTTARVRSTDVIELGHTLFLLHEAETVPDGATHDLDVGADADPGMATLVPMLAAQLAALERVAATSTPVLLLGETGTGKEVMARAIHRLSARSGELVAVNCGALPQTLLESQLFGHVKGAFSGASRDALGFVREADHGTLFLDEIGDLPLASQAALLRVLQEQEVFPVGVTRPVKVDVRVVAATNQPLASLVARGDFRRDLYARIAGLRVTLPPLRERREDVGLLVASVLRATDAPSIRMSTAAGRALLEHDWPMNIRELHQALSLGVTLATSREIDLAHLPPPLGPFAEAFERPPVSTPLSVEEDALRVDLIERLEAAHGNVSEAARMMGRQRTQVHRWIKRFAIDLHALRRG